MTRILAHGTAVIIGSTGLIFVGPAGAGKSSLALQLLFSAGLAGHYAALLSDDQVFLESVNGIVTGFAPPSIAGMLELRGSGIGHVKSVPQGRIDYAVRLIEVHSDNRIPVENQRWKADEQVDLPLVTMDRHVRDPFPWLSALIQGFPITAPQPAF